MDRKMVSARATHIFAKCLLYASFLIAALNGRQVEGSRECMKAVEASLIKLIVASPELKRERAYSHFFNIFKRLKPHAADPKIEKK